MVLRRVLDLLKSEKALKILLPLLVALLAVAPQVWAYLVTPNGYVFGGVNTVTNLADIEGVYFPAMRKFAEGEILYRNPYDSSQASYFVFPLYVVLGKFVAISGLPVALVFHLAAFIFSFVFLLFLFKFLRLFFVDFKRQFLAFGLSLFGGLFFFAVMEGVGFFSLTIPHFVVAQLALFGCLYLLILISTHGIKFWLFSLFFLASLALSIIHPWMVVSLVITCLVWSLALRIKKKSVSGVLKAAAVLVGSSLPFLIYYWLNVPWVLNPLPSSMLATFLLYGPILGVAAIGLVKVLKEDKDLPSLFLAVWLLVELIFANLPLPFARRFFEGVYFPLAIFAVVGIDWLIARFNLKKATNVTYSYAFINLSIGVIATYFGLIVEIPGDFIYRQVQEQAATKFLDENSEARAIILSLPFSGVFIASQANIQIFLGHGVQTPDFERKAKVAGAYYSGELADEARETFLLGENICFVYVGPEERKIANVDFAKENYLERFYANKAVTIYKTSWCG